MSLLEGNRQRFSHPNPLSAEAKLKHPCLTAVGLGGWAYQFSEEELMDPLTAMQFGPPVLPELPH